VLSEDRAAEDFELALQALLERIQLLPRHVADVAGAERSGGVARGRCVDSTCLPL
jgi:hypothetical protein